MTIGSRIAQKRKELALSQEALGEQLGVSRQSIYKWESDAALPEIDKLIALSRLFGVSVGWLLGVEEAPAGEAETASQASSELSEAQLAMVKEIVAQYLAAQPKPAKRKRWPFVLAGLLLVMVGFNLFNRLEQLNNQYNNLQWSISDINNDVNSQISGISNRVEEILKAQNDLTAEYGTEILQADLKANTITFSVYAVPKTFVEGMQATFSADNGINTTTAVVNLCDNQKFSLLIACTLTDDITISVTFIYPDGTHQTQLLDTYEGLFTASMPWLDIRTYLHVKDVIDNTLVLTNEYVTTREESPSKSFEGSSTAQIADVKLGVFRNQRLLAWAEPCEQPSNHHGDYTGQQFYRLPDLTIENLTEDDKLYIAALVTDSYGRQFMASDIPYVVNFDTEFDAPYLTYPSDGRYDNDPDSWTFD